MPTCGFILKMGGYLINVWQGCKEKQTHGDTTGYVLTGLNWLVTNGLYDS